MNPRTQSIAQGFLLTCGLLQAQFVSQSSGVTVSLRGISAISDKVAWASGASGTVLRTTDGGATWTIVKVPGAESLDFRAIRAFDAKSAVVMSAGVGPLSRVYRTIDGGAHWTLLLENRDEKGFLDAIAFWDRRRGLLLGDAIEGRMVLLRTSDGGVSWQRVAPDAMPAANGGEGAFAASNSALTTGPHGRAWFATGGVGGARVYRSTDGGRSWQAVATPIRHDGPASGIFSLAFRDGRQGIAVGGAYDKPSENRDNVALTEDGGLTWEPPGESRPHGYRSAVLFIPQRDMVLATGQGGTDISHDGGRSWAAFGQTGYHALSLGRGGAVWAVGAGGDIGKWTAR